jgi:hypothetical protein
MTKVHISGVVEATAVEGGSPEHPIYNPVYPDNSLPGNQPYPDQGLPGSQPRPDNTLPGSQPRPDNSLPGDQPYPDQGLPGPQPHPEHPIYIPITPPSSGGKPTHPIYLPVYPSHPIVLPPAPPEVLEQIKEAISFLFGNLPTDPNPKPTPVKKK